LSFKSEQGGSGNLPIRVLLIDDYDTFRRRVAALFGQWHGFQVVGEATDGAQGIQKVAELKPDLVIVDIALPKLNGIEVTRQIRSVSPDSKVVFLTGNDFPEVAREALDAGANAYVVKSDAANELFLAVEAARRGEQYVSKRLAGRGVIREKPH
jgi:DNA-binding NarL/FixJ family response regulator